MMDLYRTQSNTKAVRTHKRRDFTLINDRRTFGGECARLSARDSRCRPYEILCTLLVEEQTGLIHVIIHSHLVEKVKGSNASVWSVVWPRCCSKRLEGRRFRAPSTSHGAALSTGSKVRGLECLLGGGLVRGCQRLLRLDKLRF